MRSLAIPSSREIGAFSGTGRGERARAHESMMRRGGRGPAMSSTWVFYGPSGHVGARRTRPSIVTTGVKRCGAVQGISQLRRLCAVSQPHDSR